MITAREITRIRAKLSAILAKHTGQPVEKVEQDIERDYFMEAEEAVAYGLADEIVNPEPKSITKETK